MNRRKFRKTQIEIRKRDQELFTSKLNMEKEKLKHEILAIKINSEKLKIEMKNLYKTCVAEVKKEKKEVE